MNQLQNILMVAIGFGSIIFIHEFGHFIMALRVRIRVEKFYLGFDFFGLKLLKFHFRGTEYGIGLFPLGGYVKLAGQQDVGVAEKKGAKDEYTSKTPFQRIQVLLGGVGFNFLSAFLFSALALWAGYRLPSNEVGEVVKGSREWVAGLQSGDKVVSYSGVPVHSMKDFMTEVVLGGAGEHEIKIKRDGKVKKITYLGPEDIMSYRPGVLPKFSTTIRSVQIPSPAWDAGIRAGDTVTAVDGKPLQGWKELSPVLNSNEKKEGESFTLTVTRGGKEMTFEVLPRSTYIGHLGFQPKYSSTIDAVRNASLAAEKGLQSGDMILTVNGVKFDRSGDRQSAFEPPLRIEIETAGGKAKTIEYPESFKQLRDEIAFAPAEVPVSVVSVEKDSAADRMGLKPGDKILELKTTRPEQVLENPSGKTIEYLVQALPPGTSMQLTVLRDGRELVLVGTTGKMMNPRKLIGISPEEAIAEGDPVEMSFFWPFHMLRMTYRSLLGLVSGDIPVGGISGPIGILSATYQVADSGLPKLLYFMAFISINLAVLNILPVPLLDGGLIVLTLLEAFRGKPVSEKTAVVLQYIGMALLLSLLIIATRNDIVNWM